MPKGRRWTDEEIAQLMELRAKGFSGGIIAERMLRTRDAVISKLHQLQMYTGKKAAPAWTDSEIEQLKALRLTNISASLIGDVLGKSRNAVLGKLHRMGFLTPAKIKTSNGLSLKRRSRRPPAWKPKSSPMMLIIPDMPADKSENPVGIFDLKPHHCRWPVGTEAPVKWFCGDHVAEGLPYCPRHCRISYRPTSRQDPQERAVRALWWSRQITPSGQSRLASCIESIPTDIGQPSRAG